MPFPQNREYSRTQPGRLKEGEFYCGDCSAVVRGLSTLNANNKRVGACCSPSSFKPMFDMQKKVADASET